MLGGASKITRFVRTSVRGFFKAFILILPMFILGTFIQSTIQSWLEHDELAAWVELTYWRTWFFPILAPQSVATFLAALTIAVLNPRLDKLRIVAPSLLLGLLSSDLYDVARLWLRNGESLANLWQGVNGAELYLNVLLQDAIFDGVGAAALGFLLTEFPNFCARHSGTSVTSRGYRYSLREHVLLLVVVLAPVIVFVALFIYPIPGDLNGSFPFFKISIDSVLPDLSGTNEPSPSSIGLLMKQPQFDFTSGLDPGRSFSRIMVQLANSHAKVGTFDVPNVSSWARIAELPLKIHPLVSVSDASGIGLDVKPLKLLSYMRPGDPYILAHVKYTSPHDTVFDGETSMLVSDFVGRGDLDISYGDGVEISSGENTSDRLRLYFNAAKINADIVPIDDFDNTAWRWLLTIWQDDELGLDTQVNAYSLPKVKADQFERAWWSGGPKSRAWMQGENGPWFEMAFDRYPWKQMLQRQLPNDYGIALQLTEPCCTRVPAPAQLYADSMNCLGCTIETGNVTTDGAVIQVSSDTTFRFNLADLVPYRGEKVIVYAGRPEEIDFNGDRASIHWSNARVRLSNVLVSTALWSRVPSEYKLAVALPLFGFLGLKRTRIKNYAKRLLRDPDLDNERKKNRVPDVGA